MIDTHVMKGRHIIMPCLLQKWILELLHSKHMGIEKTCLHMKESIYWINMNAYIEQNVKQCPTCLEYQHMQLYDTVQTCGGS